VNDIGGRRSSCAVIHGMERDGGVNLLIAIGALMVASMACAVNRNSLMVGRQNLNSRHIALAIRKAFCRPGSTQTHSPACPEGGAGRGTPGGESQGRVGTGASRDPSGAQTAGPRPLAAPPAASPRAAECAASVRGFHRPSPPKN
jgi:hypothetical protein